MNWLASAVRTLLNRVDEFETHWPKRAISLFDAIAAQDEAKKIAAVEKKVMKKAAKEELTKWTVAEQEAAMQNEEAKKKAAEEKEAKKKAAKEELTKKKAAQEEEAKQNAEVEAKKKAAEEKAAMMKAAKEESEIEGIVTGVVALGTEGVVTGVVAQGIVTGVVAQGIVTGVVAEGIVTGVVAVGDLVAKTAEAALVGIGMEKDTDHTEELDLTDEAEGEGSGSEYETYHTEELALAVGEDSGNENASQHSATADGDDTAELAAIRGLMANGFKFLDAYKRCTDLEAICKD